MLNLFEKLIAIEVQIILELVFHLGERLKVIVLEELSLFYLVREIMIEIFQKTIQFALTISLQSREILELLDPNIAMNS
jgi:hypothetical protein